MNESVEKVRATVVSINDTILCERCGAEGERSKNDAHLCADCEDFENRRVAQFKNKANEGWMERAKDAGLDVWVQQPGETQWEYTIWQAYMASYPGKPVAWSELARSLKTSSSVVTRVSKRWDFVVRMQAWIREVERETVKRRREEAKALGDKHMKMADKLTDKLQSAIDYLNPQSMKPNEVVTLAKFVTSLQVETNDRLAGVEESLVESQLEAAGGAGLGHKATASKTKHDDLGDVLGILISAGALGDLTKAGVKETTTTTKEVVLMGDDDKVVDADE